MTVNLSNWMKAFNGGQEGTNPYSTADAQSGLEKNKLAAYLKTLQDPALQDQLHQGGSVKVGDISVGADPYAHLMAQGPHQAQAFTKMGQAAYKGINDQLDASKATLDNLDLGNGPADKLALINEARLALAGSGGRAIGQTIALLSGDPTMAGDLQKASNWLQGTPNIPEMTGAQRDAIRESVHGRLPQIEQQHQQAMAQLTQQGAQVAPQTDSAGLVKSFTSPVEQKLGQLKQMQQAYASRRSKMQGANISSPSIANSNPTTFDKLKSFFGMGGGAPAQAPAQAAPQQPQQQQAPQQQPDDAAEFQNFYHNIYKKAKNAPAAPASPAAPTQPGQ